MANLINKILFYDLANVYKMNESVFICYVSCVKKMQSNLGQSLCEAKALSGANSGKYIFLFHHCYQIVTAAEQEDFLLSGIKFWINY